MVRRKPLPAGRYVTEEFRPAMSFTLGKGWTRGGPELRDAWDIRDIENDTYWLGFLNAEEVYDPRGSGKLKISPAPEDMPGWQQANPYLKTEKPKPTKVGGEKGVKFDAIVSGAPEDPACPDCPDLGLFHESAGATWGVNKGEKPRFIVSDNVKGQTVTIVVETTPLGFEEFLPKAQQLIETVEWRGSSEHPDSQTEATDEPQSSTRSQHVHARNRASHPATAFGRWGGLFAPNLERAECASLPVGQPTGLGGDDQ